MLACEKKENTEKDNINEKKKIKQKRLSRDVAKLAVSQKKIAGFFATGVNRLNDCWKQKRTLFIRF